MTAPMPGDALPWAIVGPLDRRKPECDHPPNGGCYHCCQACDYVKHECPGCGEALEHGEFSCGDCASPTPA